MARAGIREFVFGLAAAGLLAGCVDGAGGTSGAGAGTEANLAAAPTKKKGAAQDVEAPDVFQATDSALWDGRPSLGGIWVAAPDVTNPERVMMFNPATGKSVTGALFKRERENPGPRLQLSSDAAEALGILAGQPTEINVTALRKAEEPEAAPTDEAAAAVATTEGEAAAPTSDADAAAIATAALDAVDAEESAPAGEADTAGATDAAAVAAGTAVAAAGTAEGTAAAVVDEKPKRKTWKERRAEAKAAREAKKRAAAEAAAAASAAEAAATTGDGAAPTATADGAAVAPIESAPLDARNPDVAGGTAEKPKRRTVGETPAPAAAAAAEEAPPVAGGPVRPIQVASFSKEENAKRAAEALAKIGVTATPQKSEKAGKAVWGVIVQGDEAMLKKIKDAGFADAYFLN
jgi:hypothetical protein